MNALMETVKTLGLEGDSKMDRLIRHQLLSGLPFGGEEFNGGGYGTEGDIVFTTNDGVDVNQLWEGAQNIVRLYNQSRDRLVSLLTYPVTNEIESVPQVGEASFERASEFGEPQAERIKLGYFQLGFDFNDYDRATRFTWKALRDMDSRQVNAYTNALIEADKVNVFGHVMSAVFDNTDRETDIRNNAYKVYPLYNGDGVVPPPYRGKTFTGSHTHYMVSGNTKIDSGDLEDAYENIAEHGYSIESGTTIVCLMNRAQIKEVRKFRMGEVNNNTVEANYDFIPAAGQPAQFLDSPLGLLGSLPPNFWNGMRVSGSYADILIIEEPFMPDGYFLMFGTGGAGNLQNLVGFRQHRNAIYQGLRLLPGNQQRYPLVESYFTRAFGTGIRQRAGAVVMQIKAGTNADYAAPGVFDRSSADFLGAA